MSGKSADNSGDAQAAAPKGPMKGDLTQGAIMPTLLAFSVPTLLSNILQSLNGTINSIWVGRLIGEEALAATANANMIMFLMAGAAFGLGMAGTVKIGQRFGARNIDGARRTFGTAVGFSFLVMTVIATIGYFLTAPLLDLLGTPGEAWQLAYDYLRMLFISMPIVMASIILQMGLRGSGDAKTPLIFMGVTVVLDIILNPLLIAGIGPFPELGIKGSALAMVIASVLSFLLMLVYVYAKDLPLRLRGPEIAYLKPDSEELRYIITKGIPMGAQMLLMSAAGLIIVTLVNQEGTMMTAAYGAAMQLFTYIQMPSMAIGGAVSAMAAQYIGANKWEGLERLTRSGLIVQFVMTGVATILLLAFDRPALELFLGPDSPAVPMARHIQFLAGWNFVIFGVTMILTATMRAGGSVWVPLIIIGIALYPVRLGFYWAFYDSMGPDAIWWSFPFSAFAALLMAWWAYAKLPWREQAKAETAREAQEQVQASGQPAGRFKPEI